MTQDDIDAMLKWAIARHERLCVAAKEACTERDQAARDMNDIVRGYASDRCIDAYCQWRAMQPKREAAK